MKDFYEGRFASLERYIGFLVMFHAMVRLTRCPRDLRRRVLTFSRLTRPLRRCVWRAPPGRSRPGTSAAAKVSCGWPPPRRLCPARRWQRSWPAARRRQPLWFAVSASSTPPQPTALRRRRSSTPPCLPPYNMTPARRLHPASRSRVAGQNTVAIPSSHRRRRLPTQACAHTRGSP